MTRKTEVGQLAASQLKEAAEVLARAFFDDPFMVWLTPDDGKRTRLLPWSMSVYARYGLRCGEVHTTADRVEGVAVWIPPGGFPMSVVRLMLAGMILSPLKRGVASFGRLMSAINYTEHLHKRDVPPEHWYLLVLGVDPAQQGQGLGGTLIQPVLARADGEGFPCYLESANAKNLPFYKRHGFEVLVEDSFPKGGPPFWTMKREPQR